MNTHSAGNRYLMAVVFLDLTGYTRLMAKNEERALAFLEELEELLRFQAPQFKGQVVKFGPDGIFCAFHTGVSAVSFALKVQEMVEARNAKAPKTGRFQIRVGLHLGDVTRQKGRLVGDAVNIATLIKPAADPGGIAMTDTVHYQVKNRIPLKGTFVSPAGRTDLPEHMQIFLLPPPRRIFLFWFLWKHLARTLFLLFVGTLTFAGTAYFLGQDQTRRMALLSVVTAGDAESLQAAALLAEEADQEFVGIPRMEWVGRDGVVYLVSNLPEHSPNEETKSLQAARAGRLDYFLTCRVEKNSRGRWKLKYRIISPKTLVVVGASSLEGADVESLVQELRREVADWAAKRF